MRQPARFFVTWGLVAAALAIAAARYSERGGEVITGAARAIDGDSLWVGEREIRLFGIDAPEFRQTCERAGRSWACGREAAETLRAAIAGRQVECRARDRDRYGRIVAVCSAGGVDLGAAMVKSGLATSYGAYAADEREARDARRGLWSSRFERPADWRAHHPRPAGPM
ncbi:MAG TPA: thermonuclease family protein [Xanthobacteraceae bacterium]|nr:thermonuclease family protein [Xanthobacteraceae bacterium]